MATFIFMNYQRIYDQIIERAKSENRQKSGDIYYEAHHIIPRCLGGSNNKDNLVFLTAREHFLCHWLLHEIYPDNNRLFYAFRMMCKMKSKNNIFRYIPSSRIVEYQKLKHISILKNKEPINLKGEKNGMYGKKHTEKTKILWKIKGNRSHKGEKNGMYGKKRTKEQKLNQSIKLKGRKNPFTEKHKLNISKSMVGKISNNRKPIQNLETLKIYDSVSQAAKINNTYTKKIREYIKLGTWKYL